MPHCYCATRKLPLDMLPAKQRPLTAKALEQHEARERKTSESRGKKAEAVVDGARRQLHDLLGSKNLSALRSAMRQENTALRDLREPPGGLSLDFDKANKARKKKIDSLVKKFGFNPQQVRDIGRSTGDKLREVLGTPAGTVTPGFNLAQNLSKWTDLSPLHKFPLDWGVRPPLDVTDPNQWQIFGPEFPFWNQAFDGVESDSFVVRRECLQDERFGFVANWVTMICTDADNFDFASGLADTEVVFIYEAPTSGRLEVIIDASNAAGKHDLRIENEFGFSSHQTDQSNYLSLNVFHPNVSERSLSLMSHFRATGVDDRTYSEASLTPGAHYYGHMVSNGTVAGGDTFFVGVGTRTFDITSADDVAVNSSSDFQWLIRSVEVRIVP